MAYKTLNLDLAKSPILKSIVYGRIGDSDMQTVTVNVTSRDVPVDLTGFIITFEGITNGEKTKVFDVGGISSTDEGLKKGTFNYTFPNMAFAVGGSYEIAYFSIVKGDKRDTTGEFDIIVGSNADIDAAEAETIITEYNKLVKELHAITDKYISDSDAKFADINAKIVDLQAKITQYQANVKKTADDAISEVNTTSNDAIKAVEDALKQFEAGDFYTKSESDSKFAPQSLVDEVDNLEELVNTKANDSEVVHLTGDETIAGKKTFTDTATFKDDTDWQETALSEAFKGSAPQWKCYRGKEVRVNFSNLTNINQLSGNTPYTIFNLPLGYRPLNAQEDVIIIRVAGSWTLTRLIFNTNGTVQIVPANTIPINTGFSGTSTISIE